jgi:hypothetical protein
MSRLATVWSIIILLGFAGCATKKSDDGYYERANKVSKEALNELDK